MAVLVARAQLGDIEALDAVLRSIQDSVHAHIAYMLRDGDASNDVLQDVLFTVSRRIGQLEHPRLLRAWVFRIASRSAMRLLRRSRRGDPVTLDDIPDIAAEDEGGFEDPDLESLAALIGELPTACGMAVRLRYLEQLSLSEVAEALDVPLGTVKSRLSYGIGLLRRRLGVASRP
jgi:RNA polymerase sigma-70 factor (ECF subfamily)